MIMAQNKHKAGLVVKVLVATLIAFLTALGSTSCLG